jgi:hypothetical protein
LRRVPGDEDNMSGTSELEKSSPTHDHSKVTADVIRAAMALAQRDVDLGLLTVEQIESIPRTRFAPVERQKIAAALSAQGMTNRQIAKAVGADEKTIRRDLDGAAIAAEGAANAAPEQPARRKRKELSSTENDSLPREESVASVETAEQPAATPRPKGKREQEREARKFEKAKQVEQVFGPQPGEPCFSDEIEAGSVVSSFEDSRKEVATLEDVFAERPAEVTDWVINQCRELAERWARLAEDLAVKRKLAREGQGNSVDPDASAQKRKAAMAESDNQKETTP